MELWLLFLAFITIALLLFLQWQRKRCQQETQSMLDGLEPVAVITRDYQISFVNRPFAAALGYQPEMLKGKICYKVFENRSTPCEGCKLKECLDEHKSYMLPGYQWIRDGFHLFYDIGFHPLVYRGEMHVLEVKRDVTNLHNTRIRLEDQKTQLEVRTQELAVKNRALTAARNELVESLDEKNREMELARELQMSLLPESMPKVNGASFWVRYDPFYKVGGDIYDFLELGDHRLGIFLGDVAGHGIAAAFVAALARMSLYNNIRRSDSPRFLFRAMNQDLRSQLKTGRYLTSLFGVLDLKTNQFTYVRASHPPPLLRRANGDMQRLDAKGMLLGILPDPAFVQESVRLHPGDRIFLFTDGCFEVGRQERNRQSYSMFESLVTELGGLPLDAVYGAIALRLRQTQEGHSEMEDDKTFIALEIRKPMLAERYRYLLHFSHADRIVRCRFRPNSSIESLHNEIMEQLELLNYSGRQILGVSHSIRDILQGVLETGHASVAWSVTDSEFKMSVSGPGLELPKEAVLRSKDAKGQSLFMVRTYMDEVYFDDRGGTVTIVKRRN